MKVEGFFPVTSRTLNAYRSRGAYLIDYAFPSEQKRDGGFISEGGAGRRDIRASTCHRSPHRRL